MSEWNRTSRECTLESLPPKTLGAIQKHIDFYNFGPILNDFQMCIETSSTKKKKGLFGKNDKNAVTVTVLLTRHWLIGVTEEKTMEVRSARLQDLVVVDYKDTASYKLIPDSGVQITGPFTGWVGTDKTQYLSYFIGLGEEPVAAKFKKALIHSVQDVKVK